MKEGRRGKYRGGSHAFSCKLGVGRASLNSREGGGGGGGGVYCFDKMSRISNQVKKITKKIKIA